MKKLISAVLITAAAALPLSASAAIWNFSGDLDIAQAVAADGTTTVPMNYMGNGSVLAVFDDVAGTFNWTFSFDGLSGDATVAHFHRAPAGSSGNVAFGVSVPAATSGSDSGGIVIPPAALANVSGVLTGSGTFVPGDETEIYLNIHTALNPNGELRAQLSVAAVPIPAAIWLLAPAIALLGSARRRNTTA